MVQSRSFLAARFNIEMVADVRRFRASGAAPAHFNWQPLCEMLKEERIGYRQIEGPYRRSWRISSPATNSSNGGWANANFRGYADHMQTSEFASALGELVTRAKEATVANMCAESLWWKCHRRLLPDALSTAGMAVQHIFPNGRSEPHVFTPFALTSGRNVIYPARQRALELSV